MTKTKRKHKGNKGVDIPYSKKAKKEKAVAIPVQSNDNCFSGSNNERSGRNSNQTRQVIRSNNEEVKIRNASMATQTVDIPTISIATQTDDIISTTQDTQDTINNDYSNYSHGK